MKSSILSLAFSSSFLAAASAQEKTHKPDSEVLKRGAAIYMRACTACHQPTGKGIPSVFPPLDGSDWVAADPALAIKIVIKGLQGPIKVSGQNFAAIMPPVMPALNDQEISDVLTYIHVSWGNDLPPVTAETVKKVREEIKDRAAAYTAADLGR